jgi:2-phospho-L-lactate/phosphoenolpyruvate guanylyltransferase
MLQGLPVVTCMTESALFTWTVVMPVKVLARAKSRLAVLAGPRRSELALALASDTVCAVLTCPDVAHVLVVTADPVAGPRLAALGAYVVADEPPGPPGAPGAPGGPGGPGLGGGLNAALAHGAAVAIRRWPGTGVAALAADLPALRPAELSRALRSAAVQSAAAGTATAAFVADAAGVGTTMYAVPPGTAFLPRFGGASRARHAAGGGHELDLPGIAGLRRDVDTPEDLRAALALGVGARTAALAGELLGV